MDKIVNIKIAHCVMIVVKGKVMFKFDKLYGSNSSDVINRFIVNEYNYCSEYKKVVIYSHKQVVTELAKKINDCW